MYLDLSANDHRSAIDFRNQRWTSHGVAPSWVDMRTVGLDQFFTTTKIAAGCYAEMDAFLRAEGERMDTAQFVEPSAGAGVFFDLTPPDRRTGSLCHLR